MDGAWGDLGCVQATVWLACLDIWDGLVGLIALDGMGLGYLFATVPVIGIELVV